MYKSGLYKKKEDHQLYETSVTVVGSVKRQGRGRSHVKTKAGGYVMNSFSSLSHLAPHASPEVMANSFVLLWSPS